MQIVNHGEPESLRFVELAERQPEYGEVLIEVHATGVNFPDILVVAGTYQILAPRPFAPGKEVAGIVRAVGPGASSLAPGDNVIAQIENGGYAESVIAPASACCRLPPGLDHADAIGLGLVFQTAHFALFERGRLRDGETVLVTGASGGVGVAAMQLARAKGARVIAGVTTPAKADFARAYGAASVVKLDTADLREDLRRRVLAVTNGRGADLIVETLGGKYFDASLRALAWCGRIVVIGFAAEPPAAIRSNYLLIKNVSALGLHWSDYRDREPAKVLEAQKDIFRLWQQGKLQSPVTAAYRLEHAAEALRSVLHRQVRGKIVLLTDAYRGPARGLIGRVAKEKGHDVHIRN